MVVFNYYWTPKEREGKIISYVHETIVMGIKDTHVQFCVSLVIHSSELHGHIIDNTVSDPL